MNKYFFTETAFRLGAGFFGSKHSSGAVGAMPYSCADGRQYFSVFCT